MRHQQLISADNFEYYAIRFCREQDFNPFTTKECRILQLLRHKISTHVQISDHEDEEFVGPRDLIQLLPPATDHIAHIEAQKERDWDGSGPSFECVHVVLEDLLCVVIQH